MTNEEYKKLSRKEFDQAAEKFDDNDPSVYNLCRKDYPDVLAEVVKEPFSDLLDAGCGTGAMLGLFKRDHPDKNFTGIDLSEKMIEAAKRKHLEGIRFVAGDCENLPFANSSFDVVTCSMSFHHYPNPKQFFLSLRRVLRPGGAAHFKGYGVQQRIADVADELRRDSASQQVYGKRRCSCLFQGRYSVPL